MEKIREIFHKIAQFFTSLFEITAYADNQKATNDALERIDAHLKALQYGQNIQMGKMDAVTKEIGVMKEGLQVELFESLQQLHDRLQVKRWASLEEKQDAKRYYDQIHNLGKDGWSERYYKEILELPESREELYSRQ